MLHRGNSDAAKRLRRAKSTSTVSSQLSRRATQVFDAEQAKADALTAATRAYEHILQDHPSDRRAISYHPKPALQRQGSHLARSRSGAGTDTKRAMSKASNPQINGSNTGNRKHDAVVQVTARQDFAKMLGSFHSEAAGSSTGSPTLDVPKPQQRPKQVTTQNHVNSGSNHDYDTSAVVASRPISENHKRAPRTAREQQSNEAIAALARDMYLEDRYTLQSQHHRSSLLGPFNSLRRKAVRRSMDTDISQDDSLCGTETPLGPVTPVSVTETKTHRFSVSLKNTLRRAMGRSSEGATFEMPPQSIVASNVHYGNPVFRRSERQYSGAESFRISEDLSTVDAPLTPPPRFREDSHSITVEDYNRPNLRTSNDSYRATSRVTSWADTATEDTRTLMLPECAELPSITERSEQCTPAAHVAQQQSCEYFAPVAPVNLRKSSSRFSLSATVDSKKLFSALKNRMGSGRSRIIMAEAITSSAPTEYVTEGISMHDSSPVTSHVHERQEIRSNSGQTLRAFSANVGDATTEQLQGTESDLRNHQQETILNSIGNFQDTRAFPKTLQKKLTPVGTAVVTESQPVARWKVGHKTNSRTGREPDTSGEWRSWAAEKFADFDEVCYPAVTDAMAQSMEKQNPSRDQSGRTNLMQSEDRTAGNVHTQSRSILEHYRRLSGRPLTQMNERGSATDVNRMPSKENSLPSRQTSASAVTTQSVPNHASDRLLLLNRQEHIEPTTYPSAPGHADRRSRTPSYMHTIHVPRLRGHIINTAKSHDALGVATGNIRPTRIPKLNHQSSQALLGDMQGRSSASPGAKQRAAAGRLDDKFLYRIQRGPYEPGSPLVAATSSEESLDLLAGRRPYPRIVTGNENVPPLRSQRMVEDFLDRRGGGLEQRSSPSAKVFL